MPQFKTDVDIANAALSFLGNGPLTIAGLMAATPDPADKVLTSLQQWYPTAVEQVIRDLNYELSAQFVPATLLIDQTGQTNPPGEWRYVYYLDPAWLKFVRIFSGAYPDSRETVVPHRKLTSFASSAITITAVSKANPGIVTASGGVVGQVVTIAAVGGMTQLNGKTYGLIQDSTAAVSATPTTFNLVNLATGIPLDTTAFTTYTTGGTLTPIDHGRIYCNVDPTTSPTFEVGMVPAIVLWPADFCICVATKLADLAGVGVVGIDHKKELDTLETDYIKAKNNASGNMANESFKGVRQLSASTLSRMTRRTRSFWSGF